MQNIEQALAYVTINGECFELEFRGKEHAANRDGVFYLFRATDLVRKRGERLVSLFRFGPDKLLLPDYEARIENVRINAIRRAFDSGLINFDSPVSDKHRYQELPLQQNDFKSQPPSSDAEIRQYVIHKAFWGGYKFNPNPGNYPLQFDDPTDLEYLGISKQEMQRNLWYLAQQGLLDKADTVPGLARGTAKLVQMYESRQSAEIAGAQVFPKGTQYDGFKAVREIFRSARKEVFVADNYLSDDVLDIIASLPASPAVRLLTYQPKPDFRIAVKRFQAQYQKPLQVRLHNAEIHDRTIVIDGDEFYLVGTSIKDIGSKLSLLNRLQEPPAIARLRAALESVWSTAAPLL